MSRLSPLLLLLASQTYANVANGSLRAADTSGTISRQLSFEPIAFYTPQTLVTDNNAIDLDQKFLEQELRKETKTGEMNAKAIYRNGGNSKTIAKVNLLTPLADFIPEGTEFIGYTESQDEINLTLFKNGEFGSTQLQFRYGVSLVQEYYSTCRIGALQPKDRIMTGCLVSSSVVKQIQSGAAIAEIRYSYSITADNYNSRTLQNFSKKLEPKALDCLNCPYKDAKMFADYYGQADYGDRWIMAAFDGQSTDFDNGNANFQEWGYSGRGECIQKGTVYLNLFMFVLIEFEGGLDGCLNNDVYEASRRWDRGVAYYTGSAEKENGAGRGYLLYELADTHCRDFNTCGLNGDLSSTTSQVNHEFLRLSRLGQEQVREGRCNDARRTKENIADIMYIPLIQGALRHAHIMENSELEKEKANGAVFAAAVLPRIHAANPTAARTIYANMGVGATSTNFAYVKESFESAYKTMNINCDQVGGIVTSNGSYVSGGAPCKFSDDDSDDGSDINQGLVLGSVLGSIAGILLLSGLGVLIFKHSRRQIDDTLVFEPNNTEHTIS